MSRRLESKEIKETYFCNSTTQDVSSLESLPITMTLSSIWGFASINSGFGDAVEDTSMFVKL